MYDNLSVMAVIPPGELHAQADKAQEVLSLMENGEIEFDAQVWNMAATFLRDCRVHSMHLAQLYGVTNAPSSAFLFPP